MSAAIPSRLSRSVVVTGDEEDSAELMAMYVSELSRVSRIAHDNESGLEFVSRRLGRGDRDNRLGPSDKQRAKEAVSTRILRNQSIRPL